MPEKVPAIGADVTGMMPAVGEDVSHLMSGPSVLAQPTDNRQSNIGALVVKAGQKALPVAGEALTEFATNPNVPKTGAMVGRVLGGAAPIIGGASKAGVGGGAIGVAGAAHGAWAGGKTGWFTAKLLQNVAAPVANAIEKAAPYVETLGSMISAQGVLDIAQMADPKRKDIGFLGVGSSEHVQGEQPAAINALVGYLMDQGMSKMDALKALLKVKSTR